MICSGKPLWGNACSLPLPPVKTGGYAQFTPTV